MGPCWLNSPGRPFWLPLSAVASSPSLSHLPSCQLSRRVHVEQSERSAATRHRMRVAHCCTRAMRGSCPDLRSEIETETRRFDRKAPFRSIVSEAGVGERSPINYRSAFCNVAQKHFVTPFSLRQSVPCRSISFSLSTPPLPRPSPPLHPHGRYFSSQFKL